MIRVRKKGNLKAGIPAKKVFECSSQEFKDHMQKFETEGMVIKSIESEPIKYRYTINYYEERSDVKDETWRDIPGELYGIYQISSIGRIRAIRILGDYEWSVLTDGNGKRHNVKVEKLRKQIFG